MRRAPSTPPELPGLDYVRLLGAGGFSDVFLYDQKLPRRRVAVKVLLTDGLNQAARQAFVDEANLMAQLSAHPYIVTIFHADVAPDERPYFVMEYCSGPSLAELYKEQRFTVADALRTGVRLSSAIATAHSAGILHRDIKPANVLTNDFGWPALTDFGISSAVEDELPLHTTTASEIADLRDTTGGTESQSIGMSVPWSPPEMFDDAPRPDVRSDVFSLAATIHTLLAGRTPFEIPGRSNGTLDLIGRIERGTITPINRDDVPRSLTAVLQKGMASRRVERYASAVEFARALQRIELELGYAPTTIEVPNLVVREPEPKPDDAAGSADETRVRTVATIDAQPHEPATSQADETRVRPITVIEAASESFPDGTILRDAAVTGTNAVDETVHRPKRVAPTEPTIMSAAAQPPATDSASTESAATEPVGPPRKRPLAAIIAIVSVLVVIAAVVIGIVVSGGDVRQETQPSNQPTGGGESAIVADVIPTPVLQDSTHNADNSAVTFNWSNPKPKNGDSYRWSLAEQPGVSKPLSAGTVTVARPSPGARVCIDVVVQRDGDTSPTPMEACDPK